MQLKKAQVLIGEREFTIKELTCLGRNTLLDVVGSFTFAEIFKSVLPLLKDLGIEVGSGKESKQVSKLIELGMSNPAIWGGLMACLITTLNIGPQIICLSLDCDLDTETQDYVTGNLTVVQEPIILKKIIELNELQTTLKNYKVLMTEVRGLMMTTETTS